MEQICLYTSALVHKCIQYVKNVVMVFWTLTAQQTKFQKANTNHSIPPLASYMEVQYYRTTSIHRNVTFDQRVGSGKVWF